MSARKVISDRLKQTNNLMIKARERERSALGGVAYIVEGVEDAFAKLERMGFTFEGLAEADSPFPDTIPCFRGRVFLARDKTKTLDAQLASVR